METAVQNVSEEVRERAEGFAYAKSPQMSKHWHDVYDAYIAGAASMKPVEHTKEPNNETK